MLCFNFRKRGGLTTSQSIPIFMFRKCSFKKLVTAIRKIRFLASIQTDDVSNKFDLLGEEISVCSIDLMEYIACIDKEDSVLPLRAQFCFVKEPQRARERDIVKEIAPNGNHYINHPRSNQLLPDFNFRTSIPCRTRQNEACATLLGKGR